jgi:predicted nucleotidyltransferase
MPVLDLLHTRRIEHATLLQRIVEILKEDERAVGAWLFGSRGRQTSDNLSDTDLWVVVADEYNDEINADSHDFALEDHFDPFTSSEGYTCSVKKRRKTLNLSGPCSQGFINCLP